MHRLIPSRYSEAGTVLADVADDDAMLADIMLLDGATNDRLQGEQNGLAGISQYELVYGIPNAHIIRAAFLHPGPFGARFNDSTRGAWYAANDLDTCVAEVAYHKAKHLAEMLVPELPEQMPDKDISDYDDWQADFHAVFHALEPAEAFADCLVAEPIPQCYQASQRLARTLLEDGSNGILYPSVRREGGRCLACFRPALVYSPRQAGRYELRLTRVGKSYRTALRPVRS